MFQVQDCDRSIKNKKINGLLFTSSSEWEQHVTLNTYVQRLNAENEPLEICARGLQTNSTNDIV
jgi:hypothetical protein